MGARGSQPGPTQRGPGTPQATRSPGNCFGFRLRSLSMTAVPLRSLSLNSGGWMRYVLGTRPAGRWGSKQLQAQEAGSLSHPDASCSSAGRILFPAIVLPPSFPYRASGPDPSASNNSAGDRGQKTFLSSRYSCPGGGREGEEEEGTVPSAPHTLH